MDVTDRSAAATYQIVRDTTLVLTATAATLAAYGLHHLGPNAAWWHLVVAAGPAVALLRPAVREWGERALLHGLLIGSVFAVTLTALM